MPIPNTLEELKEIEIQGKKIIDYLIDDTNYIDKEKRAKNEIFSNISNDENTIVWDIGPFWYNPSVVETTYFNGVDLARVIGSAEFGVPFNEVNDYEALEGDDYFRSYLHAAKSFSIESFVLYEYKLLDGNIYISKENLHVHISGRMAKDQDEWNEAVKKYFGTVE